MLPYTLGQNLQFCQKKSGFEFLRIERTKRDPSVKKKIEGALGVNSEIYSIDTFFTILAQCVSNFWQFYYYTCFPLDGGHNAYALLTFQ